MGFIDCIMLYLASTSPRRRELLTQAGLEFTVLGIDIDETPFVNETPDAYVQRLAAAKAEACRQELLSHSSPEANDETIYQAIVLAADTTVVAQGQILGKPASREEAYAMWALLSGRTHEVLTGVAVVRGDTRLGTLVRTRVNFRELSPADMDWYWNSGEPIGKAGGYAIQGLGARFIPSIEGSYSNVVGLPLFETLDLLERLTGTAPHG